MKGAGPLRSFQFSGDMDTYMLVHTKYKEYYHRGHRSLLILQARAKLPPQRVVEVDLKYDSLKKEKKGGEHPEQDRGIRVCALFRKQQVVLFVSIHSVKWSSESFVGTIVDICSGVFFFAWLGFPFFWKQPWFSFREAVPAFFSARGTRSWVCKAINTIERSLAFK